MHGSSILKRRSQSKLFSHFIAFSLQGALIQSSHAGRFFLPHQRRDKRAKEKQQPKPALEVIFFLGQNSALYYMLICAIPINEIIMRLFMLQLCRTNTSTLLAQTLRWLNLAKNGISPIVQIILIGVLFACISYKEVHSG